MNEPLESGITMIPDVNISDTSDKTDINPTQVFILSYINNSQRKEDESLLPMKILEIQKKDHIH